MPSGIGQAMADRGDKKIVAAVYAGITNVRQLFSLRENSDCVKLIPLN
jgi:hypothetical protein